MITTDRSSINNYQYLTYYYVNGQSQFITLIPQIEHAISIVVKQQYLAR